MKKYRKTHTKCPDCGGTDACTIYADGSSYCFSCGAHRRDYHMHNEDYYQNKPKADPVSWNPPPVSSQASPPVQPNKKPGKGEALQGEVVELKTRGITKETCARYNYHVGRAWRGWVQIANYYTAKNVLAGQKIRTAEKDIYWQVSLKKPLLYGSWLFPDGGKQLVVTEGEIDCLTVSQLGGNKYPVVSLVNGAAGAEQDFKHNMEWLERWEKVILMFDQDEPGRKAAEACARVLTPGRAHIAHTPLKDANECHLAGRGQEVLQAIFSAKPYRPDKIVFGDDLLHIFSKKDPPADAYYPWPGLNSLLDGIRFREMVTFAAGTGVGKTTFFRAIQRRLLENNKKIGVFHLEESCKRTISALVTSYLGHESQNQFQVKDAFEKMHLRENLNLSDHFGSLNPDKLRDHIRYMVKARDCKYIFLDHISMVVSGLQDGDERRLIDNILTMLRALIEELEIVLFMITHVRRLEGVKTKSHEEGGAVKLSHLRGSGSIAQLSDIVIGLERNQQDDSDHITTIKVLKNRHSGKVGIAQKVRFDPLSRRLVNV